MTAMLREAAWITPERLRAYGLGYALVALAVLGTMLPFMAGWRDAPPVDVDYLSFHAASSLALGGEPAAAWNRDLHAAAQTALQGRPGRYYAFFYPPFFLLICLPLALLPLFAGFLAWVVATGAACWAALRAYGGFDRAVPALLAVLSPAAVLNMVHGQNAFLTTALLAAAGIALDRRPALAGAAFAALAFKPQLGLLVIPALLATRRWAALGWAAGWGLAWVAATLVAFGPEAWRAFLARLPDATGAMASGELATWKLQSVLAMARTFGLPEGAATLAQGAVTVTVVALVAWALRIRPGGRAEVAAIAAGARLVTPFVLSYDFVLLLIPTGWLLMDARRTGWRAWEKAGVAVAWLMPGVSLGVGIGFGISLGPVAAAVLLAFVLRRVGVAEVIGGALPLQTTPPKAERPLETDT